MQYQFLLNQQLFATAEIVGETGDQLMCSKSVILSFGISFCTMSYSYSLTFFSTSHLAQENYMTSLALRQVGLEEEE